MKKFSSAFTMIELVFVIVVLGILAGIAVPRLAATREDAQIAKIRGDVAAVRSGISLRRAENLMKGDVAWPELNVTKNDKTLFANVLQQPIYEGSDKNGWKKNDDGSFTARVGGQSTTFNYNRNTGVFDCDHSKALCKKLAE